MAGTGAPLLQPLSAVGSGEVGQQTRVTQVVVEVLSNNTPDLRVTQLVAEALVQSVTSTGSVTISVPSLDGTAESIGSVGNVTISVPSLDGTATIEMSAAGGITIGVPSISGEALIGPGYLTQMARFVVTAEDAPQAQLTQIARQTVTAESAPKARLTQMGRQVLYPIVCESPEPVPPIDIPVRVLDRDLRPRWMLERFDIKPRTEEGHGLGNPKGPTTASELPASSQWFLERFDIAIRDEGGSDDVGRNITLPEIPETTSWRLMRFEIEQRVEERA